MRFSFTNISPAVQVISYWTLNMFFRHGTHIWTPLACTSWLSCRTLSNTTRDRILMEEYDSRHNIIIILNTLLPTFFPFSPPAPSTPGNPSEPWRGGRNTYSLCMNDIHYISFAFTKSLLVLPSAPVVLDSLAAQELQVYPKTWYNATLISSCTRFKYLAFLFLFSHVPSLQKYQEGHFLLVDPSGLSAPQAHLLLCHLQLRCLQRPPLLPFPLWPLGNHPLPAGRINWRRVKIQSR